ncbi:MAG TPA: MotA/TolQ/ExbB proton channel family protein [Planctomycetaceae bacterium]|nr:MotA/TolQ/ExbB proton channel family protein [Planctomycetaceae bacterium]
MLSFSALSALRSHRWYSWLVMCVAFGVATAALPPALTPAIYAQEEEAAEEPAPAAEKGGGEEPAAKESYLAWMIRSSGIFGAVIAVESFILVALIAMNVLQIRRDNFVPAALIETFEQKLQAKDYQGAYDTAKNDESYLGKVLAGGMGKLSKGFEEAMQGMQEAGDEEAMVLEHKLSYLSMIATTAPMLGLLGTVQGMIDSFRVIANSETAPKPKDLADGISTALFTTMEGLVVAIPAIIAYGLFRNKVTKLIFEVGLVSEGLMSRFSAVGKRPAGGPAPAAAPAAPAAPNK